MTSTSGFRPRERRRRSATPTGRRATPPPRLTVRSIPDLIAAVPYLIGFQPADSIVVVGFRGKRLVFAARGDLPPASEPPEVRAALAAQVAAVVRRQGVAKVTVIGYGAAETVTPTVDAMRPALELAGLPVTDALRVTGQRYWSYTCQSPECCPPEGTPFDAAATQIAAAATFAGQVALPDRETLARQVAPVDGLARESMRQATERAGDRLTVLMDDALGDEPRPPAGAAERSPRSSGRNDGETRPPAGAAERSPRSSGRNDGETSPAGTPPPGWTLPAPVRRALRAAGESAVREAMARHRDGGRLTDDEMAWLSLLLAHLPVRDYAWERIGEEEWQVELWSDMVRRVEPDLVPAPACLLAFAAWRAGQGALASMAVQHALRAQPDYSMAHLMEEMLQAGTPPSVLGDWPQLDGDRMPRERHRRPRGNRRRGQAQERGRVSE